jgi:hypothetical protein
VTTGIVRGDTLKDLERAANVVADRIHETACGSSSSSSGAPVKVESAEIVSRTPADVELATVPRQLFDAVGDLDLERARDLIDTYFDENCTHVTTTTDQPVVGRDNIYGFLCKLTDSQPDAIRVVRHSRVVVDDSGNKAAKFKMFVTGTHINTIREIGDTLPNVKASLLVNHLDESAISKQEVDGIKHSFADANDTGSFSYVVMSTGCWFLNEQGKVRRSDFHAKVLSMKPVEHEPG